MKIRVPCLTRPQQLGHEDLKSIEHYIAVVRNEELALREYAAETAASGKYNSSLERCASGSAGGNRSIASGIGQGGAAAAE